MSEEKPKSKMGGARAGAGRPKGSTNGIRIDTLKHSLEARLGKPFDEIIAETAVKLYGDFQQGLQVDNWVRFSNNVMRYVVQVPQQHVKMEASHSTMSQEDIEARIRELMEKNANS